MVESPTEDDADDLDRMQRLFDEMHAQDSAVDEPNPYEAFTVKAADPAPEKQASPSDGPQHIARLTDHSAVAPKPSGRKRVLPKVTGLLKLSRMASALPGLKDTGAEKKRKVDVRETDTTGHWTREEMALRHVGRALSQMTVLLGPAMPQGQDLDELKQVLEQAAASGSKPLDQDIRTDELVDAGLNHFFTRWIETEGLVPDATVNHRHTVLPELVLQARSTLMEFVAQGAFPELVGEKPDQALQADHESIMGAIRNALARKLDAMFPVLPVLQRCLGGLDWADLVHLADAKPALFAERFDPLRLHFAAGALNQTDHTRVKHFVGDLLAKVVHHRNRQELRRLAPDTEMADLMWGEVRVAYRRLLDLRLTDTEVRDLRLIGTALQQIAQAQATSGERAQRVGALSQALITQVLRMYLREALQRQMVNYAVQALRNLSGKLDGFDEARNRIIKGMNLMIDLMEGGFNDGDFGDPAPPIPARYEKYELPDNPDPRFAAEVERLREAQARQPAPPEPEPRFAADRIRLMQETSAQLRANLLAQLDQ